MIDRFPSARTIDTISSPPGQNGHHFPDDILKCISMNDKFYEFHWSLFPRVQLTTFQNWFRWWLGADQATSHYLNQYWHNSLKHICGIWGRWFNGTSIASPDVIVFIYPRATCTGTYYLPSCYVYRDIWQLSWQTTGGTSVKNPGPYAICDICLKRWNSILTKSCSFTSISAVKSRPKCAHITVTP